MDKLEEAKSLQKEIIRAYMGFEKLNKELDSFNEEYFKSEYDKFTSPRLKQILNDKFRFGVFMNKNRAFNFTKIIETERKASMNLPKIINYLNSFLFKQGKYINTLQAEIRTLRRNAGGGANAAPLSRAEGGENSSTRNVLNPEEDNQNRLSKGLPRHGDNWLLYNTRKLRKLNKRKSKKSRKL